MAVYRNCYNAGMNIRPAVKDDYERVMEMYNDFVGEDLYSRHDNDSFQQVIDSRSNYFYVAEVSGELVGFASLSVRNVVRYPIPIAELDELYVAPKQRQHGVGKELMLKVEGIAKEQNCYRVYIESNYRFPTAHKFYEGIGYTNYGYHFIKNL
jgi:GNAT superfamily N-acetyltransferase